MKKYYSIWIIIASLIFFYGFVDPKENLEKEITQFINENNLEYIDSLSLGKSLYIVKRIPDSSIEYNFSINKDNQINIKIFLDSNNNEEEKKFYYYQKDLIISKLINSEIVSSFELKGNDLLKEIIEKKQLLDTSNTTYDKYNNSLIIDYLFSDFKDTKIIIDIRYRFVLSEKPIGTKTIYLDSNLTKVIESPIKLY